MDNDNKKRELKEAFGPDTIEQFMRDEIRGKLEKLIPELIEKRDSSRHGTNEAASTGALE